MIEEAEVVTSEEVMPKYEFKPNVNYQWKPEDIFTLSGERLNILHNTLHMVFNGDVPTSKAWVALHEMYKLTSEIIKENVEQGKILPAEKD